MKELIDLIAMPVRFGKGIAMVVKLFAKMGALNGYWNQQLKKNNTYEKRFDCFTDSKK